MHSQISDLGLFPMYQSSKADSAMNQSVLIERLYFLHISLYMRFYEGITETVQVQCLKNNCELNQLSSSSNDVILLR